MNGLRVHCRKLSSIFLTFPPNDPEVDEVDFADFLISYGSQLMKTDLRPLESMHSTRVARECFNARCSVFQRDVDFGLLEVLKNRVFNLCLIIDSQFAEEWIPHLNVMRNCIELGSFQICDFQGMVNAAGSGNLSEDIIRAALPMKMPFLESIKFVGSLSPVSVAHVASLTGGLKVSRYFIFISYQSLSLHCAVQTRG